MASAAGVSRALVHTYLGDRRGLIDAVQASIIGRLETWVGHGLDRADTVESRLRALVHGVFAYVEAERDAWGVLATSGGFDHAALHRVRGRWTEALSIDDREDDLAAQAAVTALLGAAGSWVARGTEPDDVIAVLTALLAPRP